MSLPLRSSPPHLAPVALGSALVVVLAFGWRVPRAFAQRLPQLHAQAGPAFFLTRPQVDRFGGGGGVTVEAEMPLGPWLGAGLEVGTFGWTAGRQPNPAYGYAPTGAGTLFTLGIGVRARPFADGLVRAPRGLRALWASAHVGFVRTGDLSRFGFDAAVGYAWTVARAVTVGPIVEYRQVVQPDDALDPFDARFLVVGLSGSYDLAARRTGSTGAGALEAGGRDESGNDTDGDGVIGPADLCPDAAEDRDGFADADGCPDYDDEAPGTIADRDRSCAPQERSDVPEDAADLEGCEGAPIVEVRGEEIVLSETIHFDRRSALINRRSYPILERVAAMIAQHPEWALVRVEGHADDRGSELRNLVLSQERSNRVRAFLVERGIPAGRLEATGVGRAPGASSGGEGGRAAGSPGAGSRRVSLLIVRSRTQPQAAPPTTRPPPNPASPPRRTP